MAIFTAIGMTIATAIGASTFIGTAIGSVLGESCSVYDPRDEEWLP
ncbi:MAG: hypothetical protein HZA66_05830 [Rhodopseudomonas palustris]|uniref:Uncharacterized protein n=1 Tax=Rhodopseudomonas palustris TaxID=1076 RepID=A0A933RVE1_RHOPL|nr:hypothetical protein [Rhodopseudomonas palustris]